MGSNLVKEGVRRMQRSQPREKWNFKKKLKYMIGELVENARTLVTKNAERIHVSDGWTPLHQNHVTGVSMG